MTIVVVLTHGLEYAYMFIMFVENKIIFWLTFYPMVVWDIPYAKL
jgi:hypothetical protein